MLAIHEQIKMRQMTDQDRKHLMGLYKSNTVYEAELYPYLSDEYVAESVRQLQETLHKALYFLGLVNTEFYEF